MKKCALCNIPGCVMADLCKGKRYPMSKSSKDIVDQSVQDIAYIIGVDLTDKSRQFPVVLKDDFTKIEKVIETLLAQQRKELLEEVIEKLPTDIYEAIEMLNKMLKEVE